MISENVELYIGYRNVNVIIMTKFINVFRVVFYNLMLKEFNIFEEA